MKVVAPYVAALACAVLVAIAGCVRDPASVPSCAAGEQDCGGVCVDSSNDPAHCGSCGNVCAPEELCSIGQCAGECLGGTVACSDRCVDTMLDRENCGDCGVSCAASEVCSLGQCGVDCMGGTLKCDNACVDPQNDPVHCGDCTTACSQLQICQAGSCVVDPADYGTVAELPGSSCKDILTVNPAATTSVYFIEPAAKDPANAFDVYCDMSSAGGGWALLLNSVGDPNGGTTAFWQIGYAARLTVFGGASPSQNVYAGLLYQYGTEYRDEFTDLNDLTVEAMRATATGINPTNMAMANPALTSGDANVYTCHFAGGWSSFDADYDAWPQNCGAYYSNVTQHYCACWNYNLGSDADTPLLDSGWGPHVAGPVAMNLGMASDGSTYTRVKRISRWARW